MNSQNALRTIRTLLPSSGSVTHEQIEQAVSIALSIPMYINFDKDNLIREVEELYNIRVDDYKIIEAHERRYPWLNENKASITWNFWNRYRDYLQIEKNFAPQVLNGLDRLTDRVLDGLFNPRQNVIIDKRGLVVGQVQSGKTSNYTGLICKAADAGYKLIIVLAGIHNNLRSQTQLRLDEGFLGFDTQHQRAFNQNNLWIGVGKIDQGIVAHSLTSSMEKGDFSSGAANSLGLNFNTNEPIIAVVKKNARVLERLNQWLNAQAIELPDGIRVIRNKALLMIDDEADNASINTNPENDQSTRINSLIRTTLRLFDRSGYIGYTATPFANIFIPITDDDLFPRDFIINLPAPSNYIGPEKVFGFDLIEEDETSDSVLPIVRTIEDYNDFIPVSLKHKDNYYEFGSDPGGRKEVPLPTEIPESLKLAIKSFILTCTIRRLRGQGNMHNSMLVHVSRLVSWQKRVAELVADAFDFYRRGIEMNIGSIIEELRVAYEVDSENYKSYPTTSRQILSSDLAILDDNIRVHEWREIVPLLNEAASRILVREINGGSADILNYYEHKNGLSVIAIGGDKLSRGLTLEGLSVSYYLRASKMYDTLMQMGRWFGYRPGYVDLCRLFISAELAEWFCHITLASQQLREEFEYMADVAGSTPDQYALRVRTHSGVLQISASNKIRRAVEVRVSWSGDLVESYELSKDSNIIQRNLDAFNVFVSNLSSTFVKNKNYYLWRNVKVASIKDFLKCFHVYNNLKSAAPANLLRFIESKERSGLLTEWAVGIISNTITENIYSAPHEIEIGLTKRKQEPSIHPYPDQYFIRKSHIISPMDEFIDLTADEYETAYEQTKKKWKKEGVPQYANGKIVRTEIRKPNRPLLLLYLLNPAGVTDLKQPIVGFAISFPGTNDDDAVSFAVHEQLLSQFNQQDELEPVQQDEED